MSKTALAISIIAVTSLLVKLAFIQLFGGGLAVFPSEGTDNAFYNITAVNLLETGVYGNERGIPTVGMPPGQAALLALVYAVSGHSVLVAKLVQIALLTAAAIVIFFAGKDLASIAVGFGAGMLLAIDPAQAYLSATLLSEPLFIFLMTLGIYLLIRQRLGGNGWLVIAAGICFGLAGLTRNQGWLFALFLAAAAVISVGRVTQVRTALVALGVTALVILPWTYRNHVVSGEIIPVSSEGGLTLWASNNPEFVWRQPMPMSLPVYAAPDNLNSHEIDQYYRNRAVTWILENPLRFAENGVRKVIVLYSFDPMSARAEVSELYRLAGIVPYGLMLPFILLGLVLNWRDERLGVIYAWVLFTTCTAIVFWGDSRIRAPIQPYLYLFGMLGLVRVVEWVQHRRTGRVDTAVKRMGTE